MSDTQVKEKQQTKDKQESKISSFFKGVRTEFKKIIWPDRYTLAKQLVAVLIVTVLTGILIALVDYVSGIVVNLITGIGA